MTAWPCTRQMFPAIGSPYVARMSAICWSAVLIPGILHQRSAVLAEPCSRFVLNPERPLVKVQPDWLDQKSRTVATTSGSAQMRSDPSLRGLFGCPAERDQ